MNAAGRIARNGFGVFQVAWQAAEHPEWPAQIAAEVEEIRRGIRQAHKVPLRFVIWAGAGASAEDKAMYNAAGLLKGGPRAYILDSTDPGKLRAILADMERRTALPLPSVLKSTLVAGVDTTTTCSEPVLNLEKLANLYARHGIESRTNFVCVAVPGSPLDGFAAERGFRRAAPQLDAAASAAFSHGAPLSRDSLYALALAKTDLEAWIEGAGLSPERVQIALRLSSFVQAHGLAGRDKVTLLLPKQWAGAAAWTKQIFEESLGKSEELGLKIVIPGRIKLANYRSPKDPLQDRVFVAVQLKGAPLPDASKIAMLRRAGYPVAVLTLPRNALLSAYMQLMHYAVFGLAYLRNMNFVAQPCLEAHNQITGRILTESAHVGGVMRTEAWRAIMHSECRAAWRGVLTLHFPRPGIDFDPAGMDAPQIYATLLMRLAAERKIGYGELTFYGDTRYSPRGGALLKTLHRAAEGVFRSRMKMPADVYEGPAVNHSSHETIAGHGRCVSTVLLSCRQEQLPAAGYTAEHHLAQFVAAQMALIERRRHVVAITLENLEDDSLAAAQEFFHRAALALKAAKFRS